MRYRVIVRIFPDGGTAREDARQADALVTLVAVLEEVQVAGAD